MKRIVVALALATLAAVPASAAPFTWVVTGEITNREAPISELDPLHQFDPYLRVGDAFSWTLNMESSVPDQYPDLSSCGVYHPITSMTFTSGALSLSQVNPGEDFIVNAAPFTGGGGFCDIPGQLIRVRANFGGLFISMHVFAATSTDVLPVTIIPSPGAIVDFVYAGRPPSGEFLAEGRATVTAVPEPSVATLLLLGIVGGLRRLRTRRMDLHSSLPAAGSTA